MTGSQDQPQPTDLSTGERLKTTLGAVAQGIRYTLKGQHQTEGKAELTVELADVEQIIAGWPQAQQNVARQMLAKYGPPPNEAIPTRLFWHANPPLEADRADQRRGGAPLARPAHRLPHPVPQLPGPTRANPPRRDV
jgi:hypothetical protein